MKFYVVHTYTGRERRVKELLEKAIEVSELKEKFGRVVVPSERVARVRKSKMVAQERQLYPGYIIVEMEPEEKTLQLVTSVPGVTHILGGKEPLPLTDEEVAAILDQIERGRDRLEPEAPFEKGEMVKVTKGPFAGFTGSVDEIMAERRRVKVVVTIFGRPTPIDLDFLDVQPI
ncbi:MAG: transcription termination/antitermination protein NusG [candidate division WOR-3 bacterium]